MGELKRRIISLASNEPFWGGENIYEQKQEEIKMSLTINVIFSLKPKKKKENRVEGKAKSFFLGKKIF